MSRRSWSGHILGGRYKVDEILGQGGMSAVYKAFDPNLKRVVAIKMIHPHLAGDPKFLVRFEEEAAAVAQLRHPNIVQVFDFNHDEDLYYMVQEFVPGETLQERLRRLNRVGRWLAMGEVIQFTLNICEATGYAHRLGMIHRDIKPANIMLNDSGQAVLMDFGIVKITGSQQHTATGAVVGTAVYLPPEIIRGEMADPRSAIYSLGVTLYEIVSGRPPFEADSAMTLLMMHLHDPVPDLRLLRPEVPDDLIVVIEKSLAKDREGRYRSMAEMAAVLKRVLESHPAGSPEVMTLVDDSEDDGPEKIQPEAPAARPEIGVKAEPSKQPGFSDPPAVKAEPARPSPLAREPGPAGGIGQPAARAPARMPEAGAPAAGYRAEGQPQIRAAPAAPPPGQAQPGMAWTENPPAPSRAGSAPVVDGHPSRPVRADRKVKIHPAIWIGAPLILLTIVLCGSFFAWQYFRASNNPPGSAATPPVTQEAVATSALSEAPVTLPVESPGLFPTVTVPAGVPFSQINSISLDAEDHYVVAYETFEYIESDHDMHVHFFFNTVPPEKAGLPENGVWFVYGGPRPFTGYRLSDRPENAVGMCILVANLDHSVQPDSGNCMLLPDVVAAAPLQDGSCLSGPGPDFPPVAPLSAGQVLLVRGISPDESWWNVAHPADPAGNCWLPKDGSTVSGDISILPLVEPPPMPVAPAFSIEITSITIDSENRYMVEYRTQGFTENLPGTHMHFFFNTVPAEQVGIEGTGQRLMHGGPTPFTGYRTTDRPDGATELCVLVANPDHSVISGSGNCQRLPDAPTP